MGRRLFIWELFGFLFTAALGTLLANLYGWSGHSPFVAPFAQVNHSLWEEMKRLFLPVFLFSLGQVCLLGRTYPNFPSARAASALTGLAVLPVLFYTYTGVLGFRVPWADRVIFLLADLSVFWLDYRLLHQGRRAVFWRQVLGLLVLWGLVFLFVWCTFRPPHLALWQDLTTGRYGLG